jgi:hypothetical protein
MSNKNRLLCLVSLLFATSPMFAAKLPASPASPQPTQTASLKSQHHHHHHHHGKKAAKHKGSK